MRIHVNGIILILFITFSFDSFINFLANPSFLLRESVIAILISIYTYLLIFQIGTLSEFFGVSPYYVIWILSIILCILIPILLGTQLTGLAIIVLFMDGLFSHKMNIINT